MPMVSPHVRHNYLAIAVAAVASFLFLAAWYTIFLDAWLKGIGRDRVWMAGAGVSQVLQCCTTLLAAALLATESVFEVRSYTWFAINMGFWLLTMALMGAIVGGWKKTGSRE